VPARLERQGFDVHVVVRQDRHQVELCIGVVAVAGGGDVESFHLRQGRGNAAA
jgi:hypothetical protein